MTAPDRNCELKKLQLHIAFPFICLNNFRFFGAENQVFSLKIFMFLYR